MSALQHTWLALVCIFVAACGGRSEVALFLPEDIEARSAILAFEVAGPLRFVVADVEAGLAIPALLEEGRPTRISAWLSPLTLEALQLADGAPILAREAPSRHVPRSGIVIESEVTLGESATKPWERVAYDDGPFASLRLEMPSGAFCSDRGGCLSSLPDDPDFFACVVPCGPLPEVTAPMAPELPAAPIAPNLLPCPPEWTEVPPADADDVASCRAPPLPSCTVGAPFYGEASCRQLGSQCPTGAFPSGLSGAIYVSPYASEGGDGTEALPFRDLGAALAVATPGALIALSRGVHAGAWTIDRPLTIRGACTEQTHVRGLRLEAPGIHLSDFSADTATDTITLGATATASLTHLSLVARNSRALVLNEGSVANVRDVHVMLSSTAFYVAPGARLEAERISVVDVGRGIVARGSQAVVRRAAMVRNQEAAFHVDEGASMRAEDVVISESGLYPRSFGLLVQNSTLTLTRAQIEVVQGAGISAQLSATASISRVVVLATGSAEGTTGINARDLSNLWLARILVEGPQRPLDVMGDRLSLTDLVLRGGLGENFVGGWRAANINRLSSRGSGINVHSNLRADIEHLIVADVPLGHGLSVDADARVTVSRASLVRVGDSAFLARSSTLILRDTTVRGQAGSPANGMYATCSNVDSERSSWSDVLGVVLHEGDGPGCQLHTRLTDLTASQIETDVPAISVVSGTNLLERLVVSGATSNRTLLLDGLDIRVSDLRLEGSLALIGEGDITLDRALVIAREREPLTIDRRRVLGHDVDLRGGPLLSQLVDVGQGGAIDVTAFAFAGSGGIALTVDPSGFTASLHEGVVSDTEFLFQVDQVGARPTTVDRVLLKDVPNLLLLTGP